MEQQEPKGTWDKHGFHPCEDLKVLNPKMIALAENDEFEKAAKIKADIKQLQIKLNLIENETKNSMSYSSFVKNFHLN